MVALDSSSGSHCSSENRRSRLLFPTDELPISSSLQLMGGPDVAELGGLSVMGAMGWALCAVTVLVAACRNKGSWSWC